MKKLVFAAATIAGLLAASSAFAAESVKATVGHMCCGSCKTSAMSGVKKLGWVADVSIDGTVLTVTAKDGQQADIAGLMDSLHACGFPAKEIRVSGPVTITVSHLCCGGCVADLKAAIANLRGNNNLVDKDTVKIDQASRTVVIKPAGADMNIVPILHQIDIAGFSAEKCTIGSAAAK